MTEYREWLICDLEMIWNYRQHNLKKKSPLKEIPKYSYLPQYSLDSSSFLPQTFPKFCQKTRCNTLKTWVFKNQFLIQAVVKPLQTTHREKECDNIEIHFKQRRPR